MRKNIKAAELHKSLLEAGIELLRERGIGSARDRVKLQAVVEKAGVPRSSADALLARDGKSPLDALHRDMLAYLDENRRLTARSQWLTRCLLSRPSGSSQETLSS